jgi:2-keto-4-pentenoate hydratase/2-oxohepta-3-ene-1,7-dioic acid hydratase in catechol pathway
MKLATFRSAAGQPALGAVDTERGAVLALAAAAELAFGGHLPHLASMLSLIDSGPLGLESAQRIAAAWPEEASAPLADVQLLAPLPEPRSMRDCLVFEEHIRNTSRERAKLTGKDPVPISPLWYERPAYYKCNRMSVVGPDADIHWPPYAELMDYELELACVVGRRGKDIARADALGHIFGFTIFNDFSARDIQAQEKTLNMGSTKAKDFDTGNVLGPWITTLDEIGDPHDLTMEVRVNGARRGGGRSSTMHHRFEDMIAFISRSETLHPGEVIATGTVGTGSGMEFSQFLADGDVVELEIEKIGVLRNRIVRSAAVRGA